MLLVLFIYLLGKFIHFHISFLIKIIVNKFRTIAIYYLFTFIKSSLSSWSGHMIHIALPLSRLLTSGLLINQLPYPHDLLF